MSDTIIPPSAPVPPVGPAADAPRGRGYFNQGQIEDLDLADSVLVAARTHPAEMTERDLTEIWLGDFGAATAEARRRATASSQKDSESKEATGDANDASDTLVTALKQIQSSAKQKHQMLAEDGDPATNFPTDGYLIGTRLDANRASLLQNAAALILRAKADDVPGFRTAEKIAAVETLLAAYTGTKEIQQTTTLGKELSRIDRNTLLNSINRRRAAIQHAADALWPAAEEGNRPIRKTFGIPLNRGLGL